MDGLATATESVDDLKSQIGDLKHEIEGLRDENARLDEEIGDLQDRMEGMVESEFVEERIRELAKARTAIYEGRHDDGRELLERTLSYLDSSWRVFA